MGGVWINFLCTQQNLSEFQRLGVELPGRHQGFQKLGLATLLLKCVQVYQMCGSWKGILYMQCEKESALERFFQKCGATQLVKNVTNVLSDVPKEISDVFTA